MIKKLAFAAITFAALAFGGASAANARVVLGVGPVIVSPPVYGMPPVYGVPPVYGSCQVVYVRDAWGHIVYAYGRPVTRRVCR